MIPKLRIGFANGERVKYEKPPVSPTDKEKHLEVQLQALNRVLETTISPEASRYSTCNNETPIKAHRSGGTQRVPETAYDEWSESTSGFTQRDDSLTKRLAFLTNSLNRQQTMDEDYLYSESSKEYTEGESSESEFLKEIEREKWDLRKLHEDCLSYKGKCSVAELYRVVNDVIEGISLAETRGNSQVRIGIGGFELLLSVQHCEITAFGKGDISDCFLNVSSENDPQILRAQIVKQEKEIQQLQLQLADLYSLSAFSKELEANLVKSLWDSYNMEFTGPEYDSLSFPEEIKSNTLVEIELKQLRMTEKQHEKALADLEWQNAEFSIAKTHYESKIEQIDETASLLERKSELIQQMDAQLAQNKQQHKEELSLLQDEKRRYQVRKSLFKQKFSEMKQFADFYFSSATLQATPSPLDSLTQEIDYYEAKLESCPENKVLQFQLSEFRTERSSLRTAAVLSPSLSAKFLPQSTGSKFPSMLPPEKLERLSRSLLEKQSQLYKQEKQLQEYLLYLTEGEDAVLLIRNYSRDLYHKEAALSRSQSCLTAETLRLSQWSQALSTKEEFLHIQFKGLAEAQSEFHSTKSILRAKLKSLLLLI